MRAHGSPAGPAPDQPGQECPAPAPVPVPVLVLLGGIPEPGLHGIPQLLVHDGLVGPVVHLALVPDLAQVGGIPEDPGKAVRCPGSLPLEDRGIDSLLRNPGVSGWKGPYFEYEDLWDSWGNELRYAVIEGEPVVWSVGRDGIDGTNDDIHVKR